MSTETDSLRAEAAIQRAANAISSTILVPGLANLNDDQLDELRLHAVSTINAELGNLLAATRERLERAESILRFYADAWEWFPGDGEQPNAVDVGSPPTFYEAEPNAALKADEGERARAYFTPDLAHQESPPCPSSTGTIAPTATTSPPASSASDASTGPTLFAMILEVLVRSRVEDHGPEHWLFHDKHLRSLAQGLADRLNAHQENKDV